MYSVKELQQFANDIISKQEIIGTPAELYDPVNYIMQIGGKRMRPVLLMMACDLAGGEVEKSYKPALGIELFHNFTLLHDDIMDEAPLRRGQPTVHKKFGHNTAILSGDVMFVMAYNFMGQVAHDILPEIYQTFNQCAIQVCEGQQIDMLFENEEERSINDYLKMIRLKTAVLLAGSLRIGALIGGASKDNVELLGKFGENMGIAFQLQDDLLDTYGKPEKFGKKVGGDIVQNKKTYLLLRAMELADDAQLKELRKCTRDANVPDEVKISAVKAIYDQINVKGDAKQLRDNYFDKAMRSIDEVTIPAERKQPLIDFANELLDRET